MDTAVNFNQMFEIAIRWLKRYPWRIAIALVLIGGSIVMATEPSWFISAVDALRIPYAILLVALIVFFFIRGIHLLTTATIISLLIISPDIWPYFKTSNETPAQKKAEQREATDSDLSVLHFNVKERNKNILSVAETAVNSGADIVSMQELHASSLQLIDSLMKANYKYSLSDVSMEGFGMAVYSNFPINNGESKKYSDYLFLTGSITIENREVKFISATTSTPTNEKDYAMQTKQLKYITEYINTIDSALIVMGDMNSVPWSEQIKNFTLYTGLIDSRKDLSATYPAQSPLQIPIDYIFHSDNLQCIKFTTVEGTTSNHLGLIGYYNFGNSKVKEKIKFNEAVK